MQFFSLRNPFDVTKATDLSDEGINALWVDVPSSGGFKALAKPTSPMPMLVLGGKGSGKTHLLRYYSFSSQQLRHKNSLIRGIIEDGYVGLYSRCGGLNYSRFSGKGQSAEAWIAVFSYYVDLWLSFGALQTLHALLAQPDVGPFDEFGLCDALERLFDSKIDIAGQTVADYLKFLDTERKAIDKAINNAAMTRTLDVEIKSSPGRLVFGVAKAMVHHVECLKHCVILYVIDEFENLFESQQKYFNTLIREKELPASIKVGARLYGLKTTVTFSGNEEIKEGSEFERLVLDVNLRSLKGSYTRFASRLCVRRLRDAGYPVPNYEENDDKAAHTFMQAAFEREDLSQRLSRRVDEIGFEALPHRKKLIRALRNGVAVGYAPGVTSDAEIAVAVKHLLRPENILLEKLNILLLYQDWSKGSDLLQSSAVIREMSEDFLCERASQRSRYSVSFKHWKSDLEAQLRRENDMPQQYCGFDSFVDMSGGFPRHLLVLLKFIYKWSLFEDAAPFFRDTLSVSAQARGVQEASDWYFEDARPCGGEGSDAQEAIGRLAELFRTIRFSDKPSEVSLAAFSVNIGDIGERARAMISLCEKWSLLIRISKGQKDRNSMRVDEKFQLNPLLAPRWQLPIARRGTVPLSRGEVECIFDKEKAESFPRFLAEREARLTAPLFGRNKRNFNNGPVQTGFEGM